MLKTYPKLSETFITTEMLAREATGERLEIFSLRTPDETLMHDAVWRVRAPVCYPLRPQTADELWTLLRQAQQQLPALVSMLPELFSQPMTVAAQACVIACQVRAHNISHLHAHFASVSADTAALAARLAGVPFSVTAHAKDLFHQSVSHAHLRQLFSQAHHVVAISDYNARWLENRLGAGFRIRRIYNGLDLKTFTFQAPDAKTVALPRFMAVGRLVPKKGFGILIDAAGLLRDQGIDFQLDIIGSGAEQPRLQAQITRLGLTAQVTLHGALPQEQVIPLLRQATAFAAPCVVAEDGNADGLPTVLLEVMALGIPCIATDVTGIPEVISHEETGLLVPQHDALALAQALVRLARDRGLSRRLAEAGRSLIERSFNAATQARLLAQAQAEPPHSTGRGR
ncbi:Glycosyltransferase [Serratia rubidaea]|nr:Glycosyltransferase [Serratia rubidaea]